MMSEPDTRALALAGGVDVRVVIIPAAAAPDHNDKRAGQNGVRWFRSLGATRVSSLPLVNGASANDSEIVDALQRAHLIYLLGGFTHYLGQTLANSKAWQAVRKAHQAGAVVAGSSAGAMVLCEKYFHHMDGEARNGLGLVPEACVLPHHNTFGKRWASRLSNLLPDFILIGIDEETGMIDDGPDGRWQVYGNGSITLYRGGRPAQYEPGNVFSLAND
jgi:cyanophycinase